MREIQQWPKSIPRRIVANRLFVHTSIFPALTLLLHGAERLLGVGTTKVGPPRFNAASFARPNTIQRNALNSKLLAKKPKQQRTELQIKYLTVRQLKNHGVEWRELDR